MQYILGSGSPRRKQLLSALGISFSVLTSDVDETPDPGLKGAAIATSLSERKAKALSDHIKDDSVLITADTIVWIDDELLGKPMDEADAFRILKKLNGRSHQVFTGVSLLHKGHLHTFSSESKVKFLSVTDDFLLNYIQTYKPFDKAGSYGAQECLDPKKNYLSAEETHFLKQLGQPDLFEKTLAVEEGKHIPLVESIEGSYFNVMGLPIVPLYHHLQKLTK